MSHESLGLHLQDLTFTADVQFIKEIFIKQQQVRWLPNFD